MVHNKTLTVRNKKKKSNARLKLPLKISELETIDIKKSYKSLLYGVITVIALFILSFLILHFIIPKKKNIIPKDPVNSLPVTKVTPSTEPNNNSNIEILNKIKGSTYTVQAGDDLWSIALRAYGDSSRFSDIARFNNLTDSNAVNEGDVIKIPR